MSRSLNKVMLIGHLGADPDVRYTPSGVAVANVRMATSDSWKDKNTGEMQERTEWHRVVFFGKLAEIVQQYVRKGSKIYVEGRLQTRKWQGQDGQDRYTTEVLVSGVGGSMLMLDSRGAEAAPEVSDNRPTSGPPQVPNPAPVRSSPNAFPEPDGRDLPAGSEEDLEDNIPF